MYETNMSCMGFRLNPLARNSGSDSEGCADGWPTKGVVRLAGIRGPTGDAHYRFPLWGERHGILRDRDNRDERTRRDLTF